MTDTLGNTPRNVEAKILVDAFFFNLFDRESETLRNTLADLISEALFSLILTKKNGPKCTNHENGKRTGSEDFS